MTLFPLHLDQAVTRHRGAVLVGPVTLALTAQRGTTVVLGPNGAGKTSLLRLMQGAARVAEGSV
ncbi:MAG: ATP-binding cassette domain-containing protein, partial [Primorskyibacter sp.]